MKFYGQRWVYRIDNQTVIVDNAYSWSLWGQERMLVNDETAHSTSGKMVYSRNFEEGWLTSVGEGQLGVQITGGLISLICEASLDGNRLSPDECFVTAWHGDKGNWPLDSMWKSIKPSNSIRIFKPARLDASSKG